MSPRCTNGRCQSPQWMSLVLIAAGIYALLFASWTILSPCQLFEWLALERPNHLFLCQFIGILYAVFGLSYLLAAREPIKNWRIVLISCVKIFLLIAATLFMLLREPISWRGLLFLAVDDLIWLGPFLAILWAALQAHCGRPPLHQNALTLPEAMSQYQLSSGESLAEANAQQPVVLVFLRHFGCTFTRQLLRSLQDLEGYAQQRSARLVLVHMLQSGRETEYIGQQSGVARIADPYCELYRAFGLGKAGVRELFGPRVWLRGVMAIIHGCGVGHLAGDGLQMPGVFLLEDGRVIAAQPARSAADLPDLPALFDKAPAR